MIYKFVLIIFALTSTQAFGAKLSALRWMSEQYPPYNWQDPGKEGQGIIIDILSEIIKDMKGNMSVGDVEFLPWARSYSMLQNKKNTALFTMAWTEERNKLFTLVGPILPNIYSVIVLEEENFSTADKKTVTKLKIGAVREDIGDQLLISSGIKTKRPANYSGTDLKYAEPSNGIEQLIMKLVNKRIQAISYSMDGALWVIKKMKSEGKLNKTVRIKPIYNLSEKDLTYAFHKDVDPSLIKKFQASLNKLKKSGKVEMIRKKYLE